MGHNIGKLAKSVLPAIAGTLLLGPAGAGLTSALAGGSIGSGIGALAQGKGIKGAVLSGLGSYAGGSIGGQLFPSSIGDALGSTASNAIGGAEAGIGNALGAGFTQSASNALLNSSIGSIAGSFEGNSIANGLMPRQSSGQPQKTPSLIPTEQDPSRAPQLELPGSLSGLAGLDPSQQASNIANQGVYGQGNGPQEQSYFNNLINNQLIDKSGQFQDISSLSPIENSYLSQLGLGGYTKSKDLLGAINKWHSA